VTRAAPYLLVVLLLVAIHTALVFGGLSPILKGELGDTDSYTRLLRVEVLVEDGAWFDSRLSQFNAPFGDTLNWTRPLDMLILAGALPLVTELGYSWREAIYWSGALLPLILHILVALALAWAAAPLLPVSARPMVALLAAVTPIMLAYNLAGKPDQQTLLFLSLVMALGWVTRGLSNGDSPSRLGLYAGLWLGFGLWVTVEAQFAFAILLGVIGLVWLWRGEERALELGECLALGFFVMVAVGLLVERGPLWPTLRELDKISLLHALAAAVIAGCWGLMAAIARHGGRTKRYFTAAGGGALALTALSFFTPELFLGPAGQIEPRVYTEFFLKIREMRPLWPSDTESTGLLLLWLAQPLIAMPLWILRRPPSLQIWLPTLALTVAFTLMALLHARFAQVAAPLAAILLVYAAHELRLHASALALLAPLFLGFGAVLLIPPDDSVRPTCDLGTIKAELAALPQGIVLAPLNYGPQLAYQTGHVVVGGPYHRNTAGILDTLDFFGDAPDSRAREILTARGISYVLACPVGPEKVGLERQKALGSGQGPSWLEPLELPPGQDFRLYRVRG